MYKKINNVENIPKEKLNDLIQINKIFSKIYATINLELLVQRIYSQILEEEKERKQQDAKIKNLEEKNEQNFKKIENLQKKIMEMETEQKKMKEEEKIRIEESKLISLVRKGTPMKQKPFIRSQAIFMKPSVVAVRPFFSGRSLVKKMNEFPGPFRVRPGDREVYEKNFQEQGLSEEVYYESGDLGEINSNQLRTSPKIISIPQVVPLSTRPIVMPPRLKILSVSSGRSGFFPPRGSVGVKNTFQTRVFKARSRPVERTFAMYPSVPDSFQSQIVTSYVPERSAVFEDSKISPRRGYELGPSFRSGAINDSYDVQDYSEKVYYQNNTEGYEYNISTKCGKKF